MSYQISDVMMSISTWGWVHFWIYLLSHNSSSHQTWPFDRYNQGHNLHKSFEQFGGMGLSSRSFSISQLLNNLLCKIAVSDFFEKMNKGN